MRALLLALLCLPAFALGQVTLETEAYKIVAQTNDDGTVSEQWIIAEEVVPGDKVGYRISYTNTGSVEATGIVINNPVPGNTEYIANSAAGAASEITYSVDAGKNFARSAELTVERDGLTTKARAEDITHIRWTLPNAVAPLASGSVEFQVRVN
ncbi:hypothetical protein [Bacterioplanoides sp. SCSIO 12839]|uniref:hypothetical protein n=1 Tax=Bacterioplanoides sp. SCSIO 12839 TaxID=2829569 RepID=UPI0021059163|nr:hypothetical protein [Bacterioplanoides sp. SCSIO 12839]UTW47439.1 DUF11 domain-containing protein [Bacterioplanoides sp. SCSIO 12839]